MKRLVLLYMLFLSAGVYAQGRYFPPVLGKTWDTVSAQTLGWCTPYEDTLFTYLEQHNTKGFMVLKSGKIVYEKYFGTFTQDSFWYWASAGKTMTAMLVGIAQQKGLLNIDDTSSSYLGKGWTSAPPNKEKLILIKHQLTMSSGLDDTPPINKDCTLPSCLQYKADAGTRWAYHNAAYTLLDSVIEHASGQTFQQFFNTEVRNKTGINGIWLKSDYNNVLYSNTRSFARYGLLLLNKGKWNQTAVLADSQYFEEMTHASQNLNKAYGYLTWLNGSNTFMLPGSQIVFPGMLAPNAPADMFSAMGKNGQLINVIPSQDLVVVRMGDAPFDNGDVPVTFNNEMWLYINKVICNSTGIAAQQAAPQSFTLFPNPGNNMLQLYGAGNNFSVQVYDAQGKLMHAGNQPEILTYLWPAGLYVVSVRTEQGIQFLKWVKE